MNKRSEGSDDAERSSALDVSRSFVVQAPAGSGKTELLIQRYLALLSRVERPEAIVAMTFTRKAAGEIRERIVAALRGAESDIGPPEPHAALTWRLARAALKRDAATGWNLIAHPARLQVQTIDALCASLMRRAPLTLKVGSLPRFVERGMPLYLEAARAQLNAAGSDDASWRRLLDHLDNDADRLIALIATMLAKRDQWLGFAIVDDEEALRIDLERALVAEIDCELALLNTAFPRDAIAPLLELARQASANLRIERPGHPLAAWPAGGGLPPPRADGLPHWVSITEWLLTEEGTFRERFTRDQGFLPQSTGGTLERDERREHKSTMEELLMRLRQVPGLAAALHSVRNLPPPRYDDASWSFIVALLDVLRHALAELQVVFARENAIDYAESTLIASRALKGGDAPSELLLALDLRIEHLLLDEFQDTSLAQHDLVESLTEGWTPGDGRTLFVVGDPMQSIYRFREAEVGLFLRAQSDRRIGGVPLEPLTLTRNFRSQQGLVEWVNATFSGVFAPNGDAARGSVAFKASAATRERHEGSAVTLDFCTDGVREAAAVVSRTRDALASGAETVAVLVRKRSDLADILPALRASGIAFSAVELDQLSERQTVLDLCSLTHALIQPYDRLAWLAALRAPWCGLTLHDLFAVTESCGKRGLSDALSGDTRALVLGRLSEDGKQRFVRFTDVIATLWQSRGRQSLATAVRGAWLALGGPACVIDPIDLDAADQFFALLSEHELGADLPDWAMFMEELKTLRAEADAHPGTRVQIMTLHRAKGLEFDVVIMPGLARLPRPENRQLLLWRRRPDALLLAPMKSRYVAQGDDDAVYSYLRRLAAAEDEAELSRLLYVGCTRAKSRLHLTFALALEVEEGGSDRWKPPSKRTALGALWPAITVPAPGRGGAARERVSEAEIGVPLRRLPAQWRLPPAPPSLTAPSDTASVTDREAVEFDWARETARQIGIVAHRLLRRLADEGLEPWTAQRVASERMRAARELRALGMTGDEVEAAVEQVLVAIHATIADPRGRWLFDPAHIEARSEYALTGLRDDAVVHLVLDRTFIDVDGVRWIVDFKLSRHEGADTAQFLDREQDRYRAQLEGYARVMREIDRRPIRAGIYFPLVPGWREWTPEA
ncbi:MAG: UvrD-helicase domain-containing protein [Pseudomonadota bacterium]|nr:UvrD-helicase domain-containing protein [Pseudomonadota bacterium]